MTMNPHLQPEVIRNRFVAMLTAKLPANLQALEAWWEEPDLPDVPPDPLELPTVKTWVKGGIPTETFGSVVQKWPTVSVECPNTTPGSEGLATLDQLVISVYTFGKTVEEADKLTSRYAFAISSTLTESRVKGVKEVTVTAIESHETVDNGRASFFKACRIRCNVTIGARF